MEFRDYVTLLCVCLALLVGYYMLKPKPTGKDKMQDRLMNNVQLTGFSLLYFYVAPRVPFKHEVYLNIDDTNHDFVFVNNGVHELLLSYHRPTRITYVAFSRRADKNLAWLMTCHALHVLQERGNSPAWVQRQSTFNNFEVNSVREYHRLPKFGEEPKGAKYVGTYTYSG